MIWLKYLKVAFKTDVITVVPISIAIGIYCYAECSTMLNYATATIQFSTNDQIVQPGIYTVKFLHDF